MRYIYACFKGYIGFYNGLGLDKVEIDFSKCKNNIVLISGKNGSGKSTLINSLNPFPDPSSSFTPNKDAEKILTLIDNGDTYFIRIVSPSDSKGGRKQTKAFISKNGVELNDNGNITTYKEIIFSEFELDSNYISLTKLSSNDRGLADKSPAERKKFASTIVDNLQIYNDIYKTLNKKSLIFKSHINTLHTKIQNIGNKENLELTLNSLKLKSESISSEVMSLNNKIVELQTRASMNQEEIDKIQELETKYQLLSDQKSSIENELNLLKKRTKIELEDIEVKYNKDLELKESYNKTREDIRNNWKLESEKLSSLVNSINEIKANIEIYSDNIDMALEERYNSCKLKIDLLKKEISKNGISPDTTIIYKLNSLIEFYYKILKKIDVFNDNLTQENLKYITLNYNPNKVAELNDKLNKTISSIDNKQLLIADIRNKLKSISVLENRPNNCKIDNCPFISEALSIKREHGGNLEEEFSKLQDEIIVLSESITKIQLEIEKYGFCDRKRMELDAIISDICDSGDLFVIFNDKDFSNIERFLKLLSENYSFNNQRDPRKLIDTLNNLRELESEINSFNVLEVEYSGLKSKLDIINKSSESINKLEIEITSSNEKVSKLKLELDKYNELISSLESIIGYERLYYEYCQKYRLLMSELNPVKNKIDEIKSKSSDSIQNILRINEMKAHIDRLTVESNPIISDIQKISGQLTLLDSYYEEYELYKVKYDMIEKLKKYCSPTGGGIQTIFMQLYMSKTLELANQVLLMLFGGEYKLLDFIINENEFRIPFIGSGLTVDDISSGSTSQVCIMGMAINLALFHQASTKFNIARLDEINSGLDSRNRLEFTNVLFNIIQLLNIEQLFVISHSVEEDTSAVDIIKLKSYDDFDEMNNSLRGNVIYNYYDELKKNI